MKKKKWFLGLEVYESKFIEGNHIYLVPRKTLDKIKEFEKAIYSKPKP